MAGPQMTDENPKTFLTENVTLLVNGVEVNGFKEVCGIEPGEGVWCLQTDCYWFWCPAHGFGQSWDAWCKKHRTPND